MKIKLPNYLTIGRIIIVPFFVLAYYLPGFYGDIIPFTLFVIASFTDFSAFNLLDRGTLLLRLGETFTISTRGLKATAEDTTSVAAAKAANVFTEVLMLHL